MLLSVARGKGFPLELSIDSSRSGANAVLTIRGIRLIADS
jgi:hypothetical protein